MLKESVQSYNGPTTIDLTAIALLLVDLAPGAMRGLRSEQPGVEDVMAELEKSVPAIGAKAGISLEVFAHLVETRGTILKIREARQLVDKIAEVLEESEAYHEDQQEIDISMIAGSARTAARRRDESILAAFEKTLAYNAQIAKKALKTRRKNKAEAEAAAETEASGQAETEVKEKAAGAKPEASAPTAAE
jgi:hypothetical protein